MKINLLSASISTTLVLLTLACQRHAQEPTVPVGVTSVTTTTPVIAATPVTPSTTIDNRFLFEDHSTPAERAQIRQQFLDTTHITQPIMGQNRFNINAIRGPGNQPNSPVVFRYHEVGVLAPLSISLPAVFRENIPNIIRNTLTTHVITTLDVLITPQLMVDGQQACLKPAFWMFPNRPPLDDIQGDPPELNGCVLAGIFESDLNIENYVRNNTLTSLHNFYHAGLLSPDTGHLNIPTNAQSFAFYSLVIFEAQQRAVVTLHWMLTQTDNHTLMHLTAAQLVSDENTFAALLRTLDNVNISPFHGSTLMQKLHQLIR